jgi:hypothetical protein
MPITKGQWVEIRLDIDLDNDVQRIYYGGNLLVEKSWTNGVSGGGNLNIGAIDLYANGSSPVYYDNLSLAAIIDEPAQITIVKNTLTESGTFDFSGTGGNGLSESFSIAAETEADFSGVPGFTGSQTFKVIAGDYTITESSLPDGWTLYSSIDQNGNETLGQATVSVSAAPGEEVTIYFYNYKTGGATWPVPELPALALLGAGLLGLGGFLLYRKHRLSARA